MRQLVFKPEKIFQIKGRRSGSAELPSIWVIFASFRPVQGVARRDNSESHQFQLATDWDSDLNSASIFRFSGELTHYFMNRTI